MRRTILVAGASGVVGQAAVRHFAAQPDWDVVAVSRRPPQGAGEGVDFCSLDLMDRAACDRVIGELSGVTHLVYAALYEKPGLIPGWLERDQMRTNLQMFDNLLDPLLRAAQGLRHICLLQGTKAYGGHVTPFPAPAKERWPRREHENFYFLQEGRLRAARAGRDWRWTILRPQVIFGDAIGANMNPVTALGAYAAVLAELGRPLDFPGGMATVQEAVDADLLARAIEWSGTADAAADQTFNVTNGDVYLWPNLWPVIAEALGMPEGAAVPADLEQFADEHQATWATVVARHHLRAPEQLSAFVGQSLIYLNRLLGFGRTAVGAPSLLSTVKIRQAGFADCVDTEDMVVKWLRRLQADRLIPERVG